KRKACRADPPLLLRVAMKAPVLFLLACSFLALQAADQQAVLSKAHRSDKNGWAFLHLEGKPSELGFQHGYLLANEIDEGLRVTRVSWEYTSGMEWSWLADQTA